MAQGRSVWIRTQIANLGHDQEIGHPRQVDTHRQIHHWRANWVDDNHQSKLKWDSLRKLYLSFTRYLFDTFTFFNISHTKNSRCSRQCRVKWWVIIQERYFTFSFIYFQFSSAYIYRRSHASRPVSICPSRALYKYCINPRKILTPSRAPFAISCATSFGATFHVQDVHGT